MSAFFPLAALTLFATASISGPASVLFRTIRRVVQPTPAPRAEIPPEDNRARASALLAPFLRVFTTIFVSLFQLQPPALQILPIFRDQDDPVHGASPGSVDSILREVNALVDPETSKVDGVDVAGFVLSAAAEEEVEPEEPDADTTAIRIAPPPYTRHPVHSLPSPRRAYMDFTIGWDEVWPERGGLPSPHVKYTYNSYLNAYMCTVSQEPVYRPSTPPLDSLADSEIAAAALELAAQSADDDLIWALQSLSLSDPDPRRSESPSYPASQPWPKTPPAGMSPFCPPPPPTPGPPQPATTWRLEWY
ncbi:hypothetical protein B0H17DRAFT_1327503 [Mycena rosella]|uniref:Uncharacterized protein n=1 Tax=Mycena rosella TaxID=1033263 RepID=A0AAD7DYE9_MYCRO|nr:hypothetical protein B0H17DRAFT_1327503 [Mycena rosella]